MKNPTVTAIYIPQTDWIKSVRLKVPPTLRRNETGFNIDSPVITMVLYTDHRHWIRRYLWHWRVTTLCTCEIWGIIHLVLTCCTDCLFSSTNIVKTVCNIMLPLCTLISLKSNLSLLSSPWEVTFGWVGGGSKTFKLGWYAWEIGLFIPPLKSSHGQK